MSKKETTIGDIIDHIADNNTLTIAEIWREPSKRLWVGEIKDIPEALLNLKAFTFWTCFERITFDLVDRLRTVHDVVNLVSEIDDFYFNDCFGKLLWHSGKNDIPQSLLKKCHFKVNFFNDCVFFNV